MSEKNNFPLYTPDQILGWVAEHFGCQVSDITGNKRDRELVLARWTAITLVCQHCGVKKQDIAKLFNSDYSTLSYARGQIKYYEARHPANLGLLGAIKKRFMKETGHAR